MATLPTATTVAAAKRDLVERLRDQLVETVRIFYAWPGPEVANEHEAVWINDVRDWRSTIPNIKAGRKQRDESYTLEVVLLVAQPEGTAADAERCELRAEEMYAELDSLLAEDPQLGGAKVSMLEDLERGLVPFQTGWLCQIVAGVHCRARLT